MGSAVRNLYQALKNVSDICQLLAPINTTIDPDRFLTAAYGPQNHLIDDAGGAHRRLLGPTGRLPSKLICL